MLTKSTIALVLFSVGYVQAIPLRYAQPSQIPDGEVHILPYPYVPGDRAPIVAKRGPREPEMHILPYPYPTVKREPLKIVNPDSKPGGEMHILPYPYPVVKREPLKVVNPNPDGEMHILPYPYNPGGGHPSTREMHILPFPYATAKREPLKIVTHDSNLRNAPPSDKEVDTLPHPFRQ